MDQPVHTIHLHGSLAEFGESFTLAVSTPREAIRALVLQIPGLGKAIQEGMFRLVRGKDPDTGVHYEVPLDEEKKQYDVSMLYFSLGPSGEDFHIVPVVVGAGGNGVGKAVVGALMMVVAVVASVFTFGTAGVAMGGVMAAYAAGGAAGVAMSLTFTIGAAVMLSGIGQMLQPSIKPNYGNNESADQRASFFLGGQVNQNSQGGPVVLAYGRCRIGTTVIGAGLSAECI